MVLSMILNIELFWDDACRGFGGMPIDLYGERTETNKEILFFLYLLPDSNNMLLLKKVVTFYIHISIKYKFLSKFHHPFIIIAITKDIFFI